MIRKILNRCVAFLEFITIYSSGKIFGISFVVRYLRNPNPRVTIRLLQAFGAKIGQRTTIKRSIIVDNTYEDKNSAGDFSNIDIGNNCYIGDCVYFDLSNKIILEDNVILAGRVSIITHADCNRSEYLAEKFPRQCHPVRICSGAWIGFGATITSGVAIGQNSVIAANSLVRNDTEPRTLYGGIPAKKIKDLENAGEEPHPSSDKRYPIKDNSSLIAQFGEKFD